VVQAGTRLITHKGALECDLVVEGISRQRRPASEAALLYTESEASRLRRQALVRERRDCAGGGKGPTEQARPADDSVLHPQVGRLKSYPQMDANRPQRIIILFFVRRLRRFSQIISVFRVL